MSQSYQWTLLFICRERGHDSSVARKAVDFLIEQGAHYANAYSYQDDEGNNHNVNYYPKESKVPLEEAFAEAVELSTKKPGGVIDMKIPPGPESTRDKLCDWYNLHIEFKPSPLGTLEEVKDYKNFALAYDFRGYLPSQDTPHSLDSEEGQERLASYGDWFLEQSKKWEEQAKIKIPRLVDIAQTVYNIIHPHLVCIMHAMEEWVYVTDRNYIAPLNIFSPEMIDKIGREKLNLCPWARTENMEDGGLSCWTEELLRRDYDIKIYPILQMKQLEILKMAGNL